VVGDVVGDVVGAFKKIWSKLDVEYIHEYHGDDFRSHTLVGDVVGDKVGDVLKHDMTHFRISEGEEVKFDFRFFKERREG